jgi:hypothetical protein
MSNLKPLPIHIVWDKDNSSELLRHHASLSPLIEEVFKIEKYEYKTHAGFALKEIANKDNSAVSNIMIYENFTETAIGIPNPFTDPKNKLFFSREEVPKDVNFSERELNFDVLKFDYPDCTVEIKGFKLLEIIGYIQSFKVFAIHCGYYKPNGDKPNEKGYYSMFANHEAVFEINILEKPKDDDSYE